MDQLVDGLWGDRPPATAEHAVQVYVSGIRKVLRAGGAVEVRRSPAGYVLDVETAQVDARRFEGLIEKAGRELSEDPAGARESFERALACWRGPPLAEFERFVWARREAERLEEFREIALEGLAEARLARGEHGEVIGTLSSLVEANPLRERPQRLLMLALYRCGRHAEALTAYHAACASLDEIGLQPGPELRALETAILRHDPSLAAAIPAAEAAGAVDTAPFPGSDGRREAPPPTASTAEAADRRDARALDRRKVVTALLCEVTSSTAPGTELDPEALHAVITRCWRELQAVIDRHGGSVDKPVGESMMAVFGIPTVREDDALRAVRAAAEIRERLASVRDTAGLSFGFRAAVSTGLVLVGEEEDLTIGDPVDIAARLEQAAAPGEIVLGEETLRLVRDAVRVMPLEPLVMKGKSVPVQAFRLLGVDPLAPALKRHFEVPLVGRRRELGLLSGAWQLTVDESSCHLFTLLGAAGVGKTRLVSELFSSLGEAAAVLSGRCLPYGDGITFWPLIEALTSAADTAQDVVERLRRGGVAAPEALFFEVRRLLELLAVERPVILHVDDLQWAESMLLDLLDHIADLSRGAPILLLCTARPELLEDRPVWGGGKLNATTLLLGPLPARDCEQLLDHLGNGLLADARARVIAASEGNALFLEEMVALAREQGIVGVPSTIQALLAARLERLPSGERELLERGAIEGEVFHRAAVHTLTSETVATTIEVHLAGLVRKELIRPHPPALEGGAFRFRHLLIRDAAYDGVSKARRAELHARFADWLELNTRERPELDEIVGWHLEQTVQYRHQLGCEVRPELARRAAEHLHAAGRRAAARTDTSAARNLLQRAYVLAPDGGAIRFRIAVDLAEQLIEADDLTRVDELLSATEQNPETAAQARLIRFEWLFIARPEEAIDTIESTLPGILEQLSADRDERGLARAHLVAVLIHWSACRATLAAEQALLAAEHALNAGDEGLRCHALDLYIAAVQFGPYDVDTIQEKLDAIEREAPAPYVGASVKAARAELARFAGSFDEARRLIHEAIEEFRAMGIHSLAAGYHQTLAETELSAGEHASALEALLNGDAELARIAERGHRSTLQAILARTYELLGDGEAARAAIASAEELGGPNDLTNFTITYAVRARLALADGDGKAAEYWARSAVDHAARTDFPESQARTRLELARVLAGLGRHEEARSEANAALELYQGKGHRPGAADARALLSSISGYA
jgi:class 3 adenylate cyclase/DNA-binding SARP family transcriptional activator